VLGGSHFSFLEPYQASPIKIPGMKNIIDSSYWDENWLNENFKKYTKKPMLIFS
jgi:hypothetical protein